MGGQVALDKVIPTESEVEGRGSSLLANGLHPLHVVLPGGSMSCDVSVVIPVYNSSRTLKRALDSIYCQSLHPREIIVVDDGSNDWEKSRMIANSFPGSIALQFIHLEKNKGVSTARNAGISAAQCRYLAFLDSDDVWFTDKIEVQYGLMTRHNLDLSVHRYGKNMNYTVANTNEEAQLSLLCTWHPLFRHDNAGTLMVLRERMVPFDTSLRRGEDFKCWMELLSKKRSGCSGVYLHRVLAGSFKKSIGESGLSQDIKAMHLSRMCALKKLINEGTISIAQYLVGSCLEAAKYPIRVLVVYFLGGLLDY